MYNGIGEKRERERVEVRVKKGEHILISGCVRSYALANKKNPFINYTNGVFTRPARDVDGKVIEK